MSNNVDITTGTSELYLEVLKAVSQYFIAKVFACICFMSSEEEIIEIEKKQNISVRLHHHDRNAIRTVAARLFVRESEIYRLAVNNFISNFSKLDDEECSGSDLLPLFIKYRAELIHSLGLKKQQLFKTINNGNVHPDKFVAMADIELLLMPQQQMRGRLLQIEEAQAYKQLDTNIWLENYFIEKYGLQKDFEECFETFDKG